MILGLGLLKVAWAEGLPVEQDALSVIKEVASAFERVQDYTCQVRVDYHQGGASPEGPRRYRFKFYFKRKKNIRVDLSEPYPGAVIIYRGGKEKATVIPFGFWPGLKFDLSAENPMLKTPTGQRLDQTDMGFFIDFVLHNLQKVDQAEGTLEEDGQRVSFLLHARDYIMGERMEKYRIVIAKDHWLPVRIERLQWNGRPVETIHIRNYSINTGLDDRLFRPWDTE